MATPKPIRLPLQPPIFRKEHFATDAGVSYVNQQMMQMAMAINASRGEFGPAVIPSGVDVQGASVTGLGSPSGPTDAVSAGHATTNFGAPSVGPQLDIGGTHTLKGLAYCYQQVQNLSAAVAGAWTSGSNANGYWVKDATGHIHQWGRINTDINAGTLPVTFPVQYTDALSVAIMVSTWSITDRITYVVKGSESATGFTIENNGSSGYAMWTADGY